MLTIAQYKNHEQVLSYFEEHLSSGEYHSEKGASIGKWVGETTQYLGLKKGSEVKKEDFQKLVQGINPLSDKSYLIRKKANRIIAREMLFSAPKTVSILAVTMGDQRLKEAHALAVEQAFQELERLTQSKVRLGKWINADGKRDTGNLVAARFTHETSRTLDPQLHTHNVTFNVTYDQNEGRLKALDPNKIYNTTNLLSEVYRSVLAREVRALGYEIEEGKHTWRIKGVSQEVEAIFSKRSQQIEKEAKKIKAESGIEVDNRGRALIAGLTRKAKDHEIDAESYVAKQKAQLSKVQMESLNQLIESSKAKKQNPILETLSAKEIALASVDYAFKHVFERASVVHKDDLIREALRHSRGSALLADIRNALKDEKFLIRGDYVMTREERAREVKILAMIKLGKRKFDPIQPVVTNLSDKLHDDQKASITKALLNKDQFFLLKGSAGVGKTFVLSELKKNVSGKMVFLAPSGSATETLREEGFEQAKTVQLFMKSEYIQNESKNSVIVVDEAGLLSTKQMDTLLSKAKELNSRVILVGDSLQHNSVEGGDALRLIEDYSVIQKAEVTRIRRQTDPIYKEAIQHLAKGDVEKGFNVLDAKLNCIHEIENEERHKFVADEYVKAIKDGNRPIIVSPTNKEIIKINEAVREALKNEKILSSEEKNIAVYRSLNFTTVQKQYFMNYKNEHSISFHKSEGEFMQGEVWSVVGISNDKIEVNHKTKGIREIDPISLSKNYDVVKTEVKTFSEGDKILIKANYATSPKNKLPNGAVVEISKIREDGTIELKNGKVLDCDFRHFTHGYALTSQASQGKTANIAIVSADSKSGMALSKNQFYVSCSRGKYKIIVVTDNKEKLKESVLRSSNRKLIIEHNVRDMITKVRFNKVVVNLDRSIEASRDAIDRAMTKWQSLNPEMKKVTAKQMSKPRVINEQVRSLKMEELG